MRGKALSVLRLVDESPEHALLICEGSVQLVELRTRFYATVQTVQPDRTRPTSEQDAEPAQKALIAARELNAQLAAFVRRVFEGECSRCSPENGLNSTLLMLIRLKKRRLETGVEMMMRNKPRLRLTACEPGHAAARSTGCAPRLMRLSLPT